MSPTNFSNIQTCDDPTNTHFLQLPNYTTVYEFERSFDYPRWKTVMGEYWHWSIYASLIYGCLILWGQKFMKTRSPFKLKYPLIVWNVTLTLVSGAMMWRLFPELWFVLTNFSIVDSVCNRNQYSIVSSFWHLIFALSKILEYGDTAFVVLRKQKLIFLHWYHHITVAVYCIYYYLPYEPGGRWFTPINAFIHTLMYSYYALRAMEVKVPRRLAKSITTLQILQMFAGVFVNLIHSAAKVSGGSCDRDTQSLILSSLMYGSYLVLFLQYFKTTYSESENIQITVMEHEKAQ